MWAPVIVAATFGPYLVAGIRTEQLVVYGSAIPALGLLVYWARRWPFGLKAVLLIWLIPTSIALIGAFFAHTAPPGFELGVSALAGIDNYLLPVALIGLVGYWLVRQPASPLALLDRVALSVVALASANAAVALAQFARIIPMSWLLHFWTAEGGTASVTVLALANSRFTGVFGHPAEAGLAYSIALLLLTYLVVSRPGRHPVLSLFALGLLGAGSFITQSKTVILLGLPLLLVLLLARSFRSEAARRWLLAVSLAGAGIGAVVLTVATSQFSWLVRQWFRFAGSPGDILGVLSAGRYGTSSLLSGTLRAVLTTEPFFGFGAAGLRTPYDSAWLELLAFAGVVGLAAYLALLWILVREWLRRAQGMPAGLWILSAGALALTLGGSFGFPALTVNRSSTLLWLTLLLSLFSTPPADPLSRLRAAHADAVGYQGVTSRNRVARRRRPPWARLPAAASDSPPQP
jgi:hypothetical protein